MIKFITRYKEKLENWAAWAEDNPHSRFYRFVSHPVNLSLNRILPRAFLWGSYFGFMAGSVMSDSELMVWDFPWWVLFFNFATWFVLGVVVLLIDNWCRK